MIFVGEPVENVEEHEFEITEGPVLYSVKKKIATITLNRPEKLNTLNWEVMEIVLKVLKLADENPRVRVIRLMGSGDRVFSAGLDLALVSSLTPADLPRLLSLGNGMARQILTSKKPVVAQVHGPAVGWGCIYSLAADFIIAANNPKTIFQLPEIEVGIFPATGALTLALHNVGLKQAKKMLLLAKKCSLDDFDHMGLIAARYPIESFDADALNFCKELAKRSPTIMYLTKALLNHFQIGELEQFFAMEAKGIEIAQQPGVEAIDGLLKELWAKK